MSSPLADMQENMAHCTPCSEQAAGVLSDRSAPAARPKASPAPDAAASQHMRQALENFSALLHDMDFNYELSLLGLGRVQFFRRRQMRLELKAMTMGLWRLALERSFPHHGEQIFEDFLSEKIHRIHDSRKAAQFETKVRTYLELLERKREADFTEAGNHIVDLLRLPQTLSVPLRLRLTLHIRSLYTLVFDRLI